MVKILVIDDDRACRMLVSTILRRSGFGVCEAEDGNVGLKMFHQEQPVVVITDLHMPEKEGIETIMELRKLSPETIIIAMSGGTLSGGHDYLPEAQIIGANAVLKKPFDSEYLLKVVNQLLECK